LISSGKKKEKKKGRKGEKNDRRKRKMKMKKKFYFFILKQRFDVVILFSFYGLFSSVTMTRVSFLKRFLSK
jgi:hypothetical protein